MKQIPQIGESPASLSQYSEAIHHTSRQIEQLAADDFGVPVPPEDWSSQEERLSQRVKLWQNAVVMAKYHHPDQNTAHNQPTDSLEVFKDLLKHVMDDQGGKWPLPCEGNKSLEEQHKEVTRFKKRYDGKSIRDELGRTVKVEFLEDPLEILNIGNAFATCLRLAATETKEENHPATLLGWATNVNVRVIAVLDANRRILARRTIALFLDDRVRVLEGPTYPPDDHFLGKEIDKFLDDFLRDTRLVLTCTSGRDMLYSGHYGKSGDTSPPVRA